MPEIKNNFTAGKMNKDLDERLVPTGQYRHAMNVQVSTSEESNVGALQNVLGNDLVSQDIVNQTDPESVCVGSIADEVKNCIYYFATGQTPGVPVTASAHDVNSRVVIGWDNTDALTQVPEHYVWKDRIYKIEGDSVSPVFVDTFQTKSVFDETRNIAGGTGIGGYEYALKSTVGVYPGMLCYIFVGDDHGAVQAGNINANTLIGDPKYIIRKVSSVDNSNMTVKFDKNLEELHNISFLGSPGAPWIDSSVSNYNYLVFRKPRLLNFDCNNLITGINIIDDFLLYTDNYNEPKKINIPRSIAGTSSSGIQPTMLVVPDRDIDITNGILVKEENISVIKKYPLDKIKLELSTENPTTAVSDHNFTEDDGVGGFKLATPGTVVLIQFDQFENGFQFDDNDELRFLSQSSTLSLPNNFDVRCKVLQNISNQQVGNTSATWPINSYEIEILSISPTTPVDTSQGPYILSGTNLFNVSRILNTQSLFEKKFIRFGYRWKYQDGEYSTFSPFTDVVFEPSFFEYDSVLGHNKAMENYLTEITLRSFVSNLPDDVIQIDILYTEANSPKIYVVDKIRYKDENNITIGSGIGAKNNWTANKYKIKSDLIFNAVPENQTFRQWDNVPRKALAQEVTGNRIVYGNYVQNYDIVPFDQINYSKPSLVADYENRLNTGVGNPSVFGKNVMFNYFFNDKINLISRELNFPAVFENLVEPLEGTPSLKSIRNYQLGFTFLDQHGRETPVFSNNKASITVPKKEASNSTLLTTKLNQYAPEWATHFKMYVKETSNEYYNLALDRVYKAEDGNLWLSFPSSERNKVDEEPFLILKKAADTDVLVQDKARYKIIAIENEAPDFLKTKTRLLTSANGLTGSPAINNIFQNASGLLQPNTKSFKIDMTAFADESSVNLHEVQGLMQFDFKDSTGRYSKKYNIVDISQDGTDYTVVLETPILSTEDWMFSTGTTYIDDLTIRFYKSITRVKPEFDGKFFVKIHSDQIANLFLNTNANSDVEYEIVNALNVFYFSCTGSPNVFGTGNQGTTHPVASGAPATWTRFTSSSFNPHTGATGPGTGITYSAGDSNTGVESADGVRDWQQLLDFEPGFGTPKSGWFIDETYYAGTHPDFSSTDVNSPNHVTNGGTNFRYGRGIYEDGGQQYIDIAFSQIEDSASVADSGVSGYGTTTPSLNFGDINDDKIWAIGSSSNPAHVDQNQIISLLSGGTKFKFVDDSNDVIYTISDTVNVTKERRYNYLAWNQVQFFYDEWAATVSDPNFPNNEGNPTLKTRFDTAYNEFILPVNRRVTYKIPIDKDINTQTLIGTKQVTTNDRTTSAANANETSVTIQFLEQRTDDDNDSLRSSNPAIFETEPKESVDLDLFYSTGGIYPTSMSIETAEQWIPRGSVVTCDQKPLLLDFNIRTIVTGFEQNDNGQLLIKFNIPLNDPSGFLGSQILGANELVFSRPDGGFTTLKGNWYEAYTNATTPNLISAPAPNFVGTPVFPNETGYEIYPSDIVKQKIGLSWFNCYSFGNGVESNRLRDDFNQMFIDKGVKVSTTIDEPYEEERRSNGLIYSGLYNSISGVNNLNQFIQAEKITKDINPTYGSIQKLFSRQTDLITLCEDKVIRIAANKDAVFNADGNPQLIASNNVLGQVLPFSGEYGISKNPESFVKENYRAYFTDKTRSAVIRLSKDGLTAISDHGMNDYFKEYLNYHDKLVGSYDDKKQEYNLTLSNYHCGEPANFVNAYSTLTFNETVKGWTSFKSFDQENGVSLNNEYYTFKNSLPYKHHVQSVDRNTFYGVFEATRVTFLLNQSPEIIKSYRTLNYEGSQANVVEDIIGPIDSNVYQGYDNLNQKDGWFVQNIYTDMQRGSLETFVEKEGKWFNYLKGIPVANAEDIDTSEFSFQGIGRAVGLAPAVYGCTDSRATVSTYNPAANVFLPGSCEYAGCTDSNATNQTSFEWPPGSGVFYNATVDDGSCDYIGCYDVNASNYNVTCNGYDLTLAGLTITTVDNTCCNYPDTWDCDPVNGGCMKLTNGQGQYATALDCDNAIGTPGGCPACGSSAITGCLDNSAMNYLVPGVDCDTPSTPACPNCHDQTACIPYYFGCWDHANNSPLTTNMLNSAGYEMFVPRQAQLDSTTITSFTDVYGATINGVVNQAPYEISSYSYVDVVITSPTFGQTIVVTADNGVDPSGTSNVGFDCSCVYSGCMDDGYCTDNPDHFDPTSSNFISLDFHLCPDGSGNSYGSPNIGVPSPNYAPWATIDDGSCCTPGCTNPLALNYDSAATCDDGSCNIFSCSPVTMPQYMLNEYPLLTTTKSTSFIVDPVLEAILESPEYEALTGAGANNQFASDQEVCTSCFEQQNISGSNTILGLPTEDLANDPNATGQLSFLNFEVSANPWGPQNPVNFQSVINASDFSYGYIGAFNGIEEFALTLDNVSPQGVTFTGINFSVCLQANTNFMSMLSPNQPQLNTPYSISQTPDYHGIEFSQLDLLIPWMNTLALKNLPLSYQGYRAALNLSNFGASLPSGGPERLHLADCGITHLELPDIIYRLNGLSIVNDTKFGTRGVSSTALGFTTTPLYYDHGLYEGDRRFSPLSTFCNNPSAPQTALPNWDSNINNYLCDPIEITNLGVDLPASPGGLYQNIKPINLAKTHNPNPLEWNTNPCVTTFNPNLPVFADLRSNRATFDIREYYDQPSHAPWEDGSGNIIACTSNFGTYGTTPAYDTDHAWARGVRFEQVNSIAGLNTLTNPCTGNTGIYIEPCRYKAVKRNPKAGIKLVNLSKLQHIYIHPDVDPRSLINTYVFNVAANTWTIGAIGPASNFTIEYPNSEDILSNNTGAGFTTRGCHPDLQIHVGTTTGGSNTGQLTGRHSQGSADPLVDVTNTTRVQDWEMIFGTNDPTSEYYVPELRDHFLRYFGANHKFVD